MKSGANIGLGGEKMKIRANLIAIAVVMNAIAGCAYNGQLTPTASENQKQILRGGSPTILSVKNAIVTVAPAIANSSDSAEVKAAEDVKIVLKFSSVSSQNSIIVLDSLQKEGFTEIIKDAQSVSNTTTISFHNSIPDSLKNKVIASVSRIYEKVIIQNSNDFDDPITIQLGND